MEHPTKSVEPTGGVIRPIPKFSIMTTPNCTGSIPTFVTTGRSIGVVIKINGAISIIIPSANKIKFININIKNLLSVIERR